MLQRRTLALGAAAFSTGTGLLVTSLKPSFAMEVELDTFPGAATKQFIKAITDAGSNLFSQGEIPCHSMLVHYEATSILGAARLPEWAEVTWREGVEREDSVYEHRGVVIARHRVEIAKRIPRDILNYAAGDGRSLHLIFWLDNDRVLMGWKIRQPLGSNPLFVKQGGDLMQPDIFNGILLDPGWFIDRDGRQVPLTQARPWDSLPNYGLEVTLDNFPGAPEKGPVTVRSSSGRLLQPQSRLWQHSAMMTNYAQTETFFSEPVPEFVDISWLTAPSRMGGVPGGDHRVQVRSRIPRRALEDAAQKGSNLRVIFWLKEDGVLFAWEVRRVRDVTVGPELIGRGGEFKAPTIHERKMIDPGWYPGPNGERVPFSDKP